MAYLKNKEFQILVNVYVEMRDNNGKVSFETACKYGDLLRKIEQDKTASKEKSYKIISEKRKTDKNYARKRKVQEDAKHEKS